MRRLVWATLVLALLLGTSTSLVRAQTPNPLLPNPNTAVLKPAGVSWSLPIIAAPVLPPSQPYFGPLLCPSDVITAFALLACGSLAIAPPGAGIAPAPVVTSGSGSLFIAPVSCLSFTGGPCVTLCADGQWSSSTGSGTCSDHGGEAVPIVPVGGCVSNTGGPCITLCRDGTWSSSTGSGTCSDHGGEAH
jgi:hypothetical protein